MANSAQKKLEQSIPLDPNRLYSMGNKGEIRKFINVSSVTQWRWEKAGRLDVVRIGRQRFVRGSTIIRLIESGSE